MKTKFYYSVLFVLIVILSVTTISSCDKLNETPPEFEVSDIDVFIWNGLRQYYYWVDNVPELNSDNYASDAELVDFLNSFNGEHENLFYDLLYDYGSVDKWSWIVDDYSELAQLFQGITTSTGMEYGLRRINGSDNLIAYVRYVVPGSSAEDEEVQRGQLFKVVNGVELTIDNWSTELGKDEVIISYSDYDGGAFTLNGLKDTLQAKQVTEDPIHYSEIKDVDGTKVAYLVYNGFTSNYDFDLNALFGSYVTEGVQELVLDLRYNGGGSVRTATYLASMIHSTNTSNTLLRTQYNDLIQDYLLNEYGESFFIDTFKDQLVATDNNSAEDLNSLGLSKVYILTTGSSASASELIINGLKPYMDVYLIGTNTHGKYVGSITVRDYDSEGDLNNSHDYAMQPIAFTTVNSDGTADFINGFEPDIEITEDLDNILPFGDENEVLLKAALDDIRGVTILSSLKGHQIHTEFKDSKDRRKFGKEMYRDILIKQDIK